MSCRYKKSTALTSLGKKVIWVSSDEDVLCEGKTTLCGALGSQGSPVRFSKLFDLLKSQISVTDVVQINFSTGTYSLPNQDRFVFPAFKTLILSGNSSLLTELHGTWEFPPTGGRVVIMDLSLHGPDGKSVVRARDVSLELSGTNVYGNTTDPPLLLLTDLVSFKMQNLQIYQKGSGWCVLETRTSMRNLPVRNTFTDVSVESAGGFYQTINMHFVKMAVTVSNLVGTTRTWFVIFNSGSDLTFHFTGLQLVTIGDDYLFQCETAGNGITRCTFRGGDLESPEGGHFQFKCSDRGKTVFNVSDFQMNCVKTWRYLEGSGQSMIEESITDCSVHQIKSGSLPLMVNILKHSSSFQNSITNSKFRSELNVFLCENDYSGKTRHSYVGANNEWENSGPGGVYKTRMKDQAVFLLKCTAEVARGFSGIVEDVITDDDSVFDIDRSSYSLDTTEGSLNCFYGNGKSRIVNKMNNVQQKAGYDPNGNREWINMNNFSGESEYVMSGNGITKTFDLEDHETGTINIVQNKAIVTKTRLNEFLNLGFKGKGFSVETHDYGVFRGNVSNLQGKAGTCFQHKTNGASSILSQKANMILECNSFNDILHNSTQPYEDISTVSGINRRCGANPLLSVQSDNIDHGPANYRLTNTVMRCSSDNPEDSPVIIINGCKGDNLCDNQLSMTNYRVATNVCKALRGQKARIHFVSSEASSTNGAQMFDLQECDFDSRASSILGTNAVGFQNKNSSLMVSASTAETKKLCENCDQSKILLNTANVKVPEGTPVVDGGICTQSASNCLIGSSIVNAILEDLPTTLQSKV